MNQISKTKWIPQLLVAVLIAFPSSTVAGCQNLSPSSAPMESAGHLNPVLYDHTVRTRPDLGADPRLLVVTITEEDIKSLGQWPLSDQVLAQALQELQRHQPKVIGLDLFRDLPVEPGYQELAAQLQKSNVIVVTYLGGDGAKIPPPPGIPKERIGFIDMVIDPDNVVRRNLLFVSHTTGTSYSFGVRLALAYLDSMGIQPKPSEKDPNHMHLGKAVFVPIEAYSVGTQKIDAQGYQIPLNYRSATNVAQQVTLTQVLKGEFDPKLVQGRIILIGITAPSLKDVFYTPYPADGQGNLQMAGVLLQAQMVSQILSAALGD